MLGACGQMCESSPGTQTRYQDQRAHCLVVRRLKLTATLRSRYASSWSCFPCHTTERVVPVQCGPARDTGLAARPHCTLRDTATSTAAPTGITASAKPPGLPLLRTGERRRRRRLATPPLSIDGCPPAPLRGVHRYTVARRALTATSHSNRRRRRRVSDPIRGPALVPLFIRRGRCNLRALTRSRLPVRAARLAQCWQIDGGRGGQMAPRTYDSILLRRRSRGSQHATAPRAGLE